jgi:hypothetical protein
MGGLAFSDGPSRRSDKVRMDCGGFGGCAAKIAVGVGRVGNHRSAFDAGLRPE